MPEPKAFPVQAAINFRGLADLFSTFKELLPFLLEIVECFKDMTPEEQQHSVSIIARFSGDSAEERDEIKRQLQQLVS